MAFDGNEGEIIDLRTAGTWTSNYQEQNEGGVKAHFYGKNKLNQILNQTGCVGIRIYRAIDDVGADVLVLVGVDGEENNMEGGVILENGTPCPPRCGTSSSL